MASLLRQLLTLAAITGGAAWVITAYDLSPDASSGGPGRERPAPLVEVEPIATVRLERSISAVGTGRARRSVEIRPSGTGRVEGISFASGDLVTEGAALVRLDDASERAAVAEAEAEIEETTAAYDRAATLQKQGRVTGQSFEGARADLQRAEARLGRVRAALQERVIRAPFTGIIGLTDLTEGALVARETIIATLEDLTVLRVEFRTPERFFADVAVGDEVRVETTIHPGETFDGEVVAVDRRVDETSRAFRVRAEIPNGDMKLPSGLFLRVTMVLAARMGVVAPEQAVIIEGDGAFVYVVDAEGVVERRAITVGQRAGGMAEALRGLAPGERVVTRGIQKVRDGAPVRIIGEGAPAGGKPSGAPEGGGPGAEPTAGEPAAAPAASAPTASAPASSDPAASVPAPAPTPAASPAAPTPAASPAAPTPAAPTPAASPASPAASAPAAGAATGAPRT
jgi:membrane fusion protein (multidrug efflux system)